MKKFLWKAVQYKKGWKLGYYIGDSDIKYLDCWFNDEGDVRNCVNGNIVFIPFEKDDR